MAANQGICGDGMSFGAAFYTSPVSLGLVNVTKVTFTQR